MKRELIENLSKQNNGILKTSDVEKLGITKTKIAEYKTSDSIYDKIMLGMLYIKTGETRRGVILLDEICQSNPELLITPAIRAYLKEVSSTL